MRTPSGPTSTSLTAAMLRLQLFRGCPSAHADRTQPVSLTATVSLQPLRRSIAQGEWIRPAGEDGTGPAGQRLDRSSLSQRRCGPHAWPGCRPRCAQGTDRCGYPSVPASPPSPVRWRGTALYGDPAAPGPPIGPSGRVRSSGVPKSTEHSRIALRADRGDCQRTRGSGRGNGQRKGLAPVAGGSAQVPCASGGVALTTPRLFDGPSVSPRGVSSQAKDRCRDPRDHGAA